MRSLGDAQRSAADSCDPVEDAVQDVRRDHRIEALGRALPTT